jgi:starvation-inducible DNA-binding protein
VEINTGLAGPARKEIADRVSSLLADTYTLCLKTHVYHWNVTGNMFRACTPCSKSSIWSCATQSTK